MRFTKTVTAARWALKTAVVVLLCCTLSGAREKERAAAPLTVDLDSPYDKVVAVVRDIANDGVVRGTAQYEKDFEIGGAESANECKLFRAKDVAPGTLALFKVKRGALAPTHFVQSNDIGTLAVRYLLRDAGTNKTEITIEAVFVEDSRHGSHPSDGNVETSEFLAIAARLKAIRDEQADAKQKAERQAQMERVITLRRELKAEQQRLDDTTSQVHDLEKRVEQVRALTQASVTRDDAGLKAAPYTAAPTLQLLNKGQQLTILSRTPSWLRVRAADGHEGWVYHLFMEAAQ